MTAFHLKYRPKSLDRVIGHEKAVAKLKELVSSDKLPSAFLFIGPSSAGKTTLARCLAAEINGTLSSDNYTEINAADQRTIDDVRDLVRVSKMRPLSGNKRVIVVDEVQQILSNNPAAQTLLKPLEEPPKGTVWILCSMEPHRFSTGVGRAIANRCLQISLEEHTAKDRYTQAKRIARKENILANDEILKQIAKSAPEMRSLANMMQALPSGKKITSDDLTEVLESEAAANDDAKVATVLIGVIQGQYKIVQRTLLDVADPFGFINKLLWASGWLLNSIVLNGAHHSKVWPNKAGIEVKKQIPDLSLKQAALLNTELIELKAASMTFQVDPPLLLSAKLYRILCEMIQISKVSKSRKD